MSVALILRTLFICFKNLCVFVLLTEVALALEGLIPAVADISQKILIFSVKNPRNSLVFQVSFVQDTILNLWVHVLGFQGSCAQLMQQG